MKERTARTYIKGAEVALNDRGAVIRIYKRQPPQMAHYHMRRSVISIGRPEITWIVGKLEVICEWRNR